MTTTSSAVSEHTSAPTNCAAERLTIVVFSAEFGGAASCVLELTRRGTAPLFI